MPRSVPLKLEARSPRAPPVLFARDAKVAVDSASAFANSDGTAFPAWFVSMPTSLAAASSLEVSFSPACDMEAFSRVERMGGYHDTVTVRLTNFVGARLRSGAH